MYGRLFSEQWTGFDGWPREVAEKSSYDYPEGSDEFATRLVRNNLETE